MTKQQTTNFSMTVKEARDFLRAETATPWGLRKWDDQTNFWREASEHVIWADERFKPGDRVCWLDNRRDTRYGVYIKAGIRKDVMEAPGEPGNPISWGFLTTVATLVLVVKDDEGTEHYIHGAGLSKA